MKSRRIKIGLTLLAIVLGTVGYFAYSILNALNHLPEAYAAWDTGGLLVEYMNRHDDHWPHSWEDLAQMVKNSDVRVMLRGLNRDDAAQYVRSLDQTIWVDWNFDPQNTNAAVIVSPKSGGKFVLLWEDPNEMVREHLKCRASTRPISKP